MPTIQIKTTVLPGGRIEVQSADLPEGREISIEIIVEEPKRSFDEILKDFPPRRSFRDAAEVDRFINEERDFWDR